MTAAASLNKDVHDPCLKGEDECKDAASKSSIWPSAVRKAGLKTQRVSNFLCENIDLWTADLRFRIQAGLLTLFIATLIFPVSQ